MNGGFLPDRSGGDQGFELELVGVDQEAHERHLVVGLVADVAEDDHARASGELVGRRGLCGSEAGKGYGGCCEQKRIPVHEDLPLRLPALVTAASSRAPKAVKAGLGPRH